MAGRGKSTISSNSYTASLKKKGGGLLGASFFFKRGEEDQGSGKKPFPTLIGQLATKISQLRPSIQKAVEGDADISERALREQFEKLLL